ncbi:MAG: hypothetical protein BWY46_00709 [Firmicutes bacterium ADurb.Bin300]|nr:MAG: hypothetical protein BWY46_00709 [Firmicutes bacterium ADurb.Bin300]
MEDIFEVAMILCFGISWPVSIVKSYKSRSTKGKSIIFLVFILLGYTCGILAKIASGSINYVLIFYLINFVMVFFDISLYFRNKRLENQ